MAKPLVLLLFNTSRYAPEPWARDGRFRVVSVDLQNRNTTGQYGEYYLQGNAGSRAFLKANGLDKPALTIAFPPCTDLAVSGALRWAGKALLDPDFQRKALKCAKFASTLGGMYAIENPVGKLATGWRKPDLYWHPYEFGQYAPKGPHPEFPKIIPEQDAYSKKTGLWAGGGLVLPKKRPVPLQPGSHIMRLGGKSGRTKYIRSLTPRGYAWALYHANADKVAASRRRA